MALSSLSLSEPVRFAVFEVDPRTGELRKNGVRVKLEGQPLQILTLLLERPGELVTREELQDKLWPAGTYVDFEHSINAAIKRLREALDDSAQTPRFIETLPRRGYRFIYPLNGAAHSAAPVPVPAPVSWRRPWIAGSAILGLLLISLAAAVFTNALRMRERLFGPPVAVTSVAVLPLENLTGDSAQDYFVDGLHDELITQLAQISSLKVISRYSVVRVNQAKGKSLSDMARELGVETVMEGTVQRFGDHIHLSVQLIRAQDDRHLWARSYDRALRDVPRLPGDVARAMAGDLRIPLAPQEQARIGGERPSDPEVYSLYLKARYFRQKATKPEVEKAEDYYRQAIDLDPTYAPAWAGLGGSYQWLSRYGDRENVRAKARAAFLKALQLDEALVVAHLGLGGVYLDDWDWQNAEKEFIRAEELDPAWRGPSLYFTRLGLFDDAVLVQRSGTERDPLDFGKSLILGWTYFMAGRYDEAISQQKKTIELDPNNRGPHYQLAWSYAKQGMFQQALAECDTYSQSEPEVAAGDDCGWVYALAGQRAKALAFMERVRKKPNGGDEQLGQFARVYDALGDREQAMKLLFQRAGAPNWHGYGLKMTPLWSDALRADPRFQELVSRAGFPEPSPILVARARRSP